MTTADSQPCAASVRQFSVGATPRYWFWRPCKRYALAGSAYCVTHQYDDDGQRRDDT